MSFSFTVNAATKEAVKEAALVQLEASISNQPVHQQDKDAVEKTVDLYLSLLSDAPEGRTYTLSVSGSVGWAHDDADPTGANKPPLTAVNVSVSAWHTV